MEVIAEIRRRHLVSGESISSIALTAPPRPVDLSLPEQLRLQVEPVADCSRYDRLRGGQYVH